MTGRSIRTQSTPHDARRDPISGRTVVIAPARAKRPGAKRGELERETPEELERCPFCEGREDRTPPETFAIGKPGREADTPGWQVRVVPNLYPAFERQEVVIHTPRHARSIAELTEDELLLIAQTWRARAEEARREGFAYLQVLINEGREAGASLAHGHSQLVWMRDAPPISGRDAEPPECRVCRLLSAEMNADERIVEDRGDIVLLCPHASRVPYEMLVGPHETHNPDAFADLEDLGKALILIGDALRRLRQIEGAVPVNVWLHTAPFGAEGHWRFEIFPRLTILAGLELGAGIYVNWLPPEEAAVALRNAKP